MNVDTIVDTNLLYVHQLPWVKVEDRQRVGVIPRTPFKESTCFVEDEALSSYQSPNHIRSPSSWNLGLRLPVLVTNPVGNDNFRHFIHNRLSSCVHEIKRPAIVGLLKSISV